MEKSNVSNLEKEKMNINAKKDLFEESKSDYFVQKIFENLNQKIAFKIIKYNKKIQQKLNIGVNDYKKYSEIYSSIEIEIKPIYNQCGTFINPLKGEEEYYHIYFDNNKEEVKRNYLNKDDKVSIINIKIDHQIKSFEDLFKDCYLIESINFNKFNRNNITDMSCMFYQCTGLKEINLSYFNTDSVTKMDMMFSRCLKLEKLDLSKFNTHNVRRMFRLFYECGSLKELIFPNFDFSNVTNMKSMFYGCSDELLYKIISQYKDLKEEAFNYSLF